MPAAYSLERVTVPRHSRYADHEELLEAGRPTGVLIVTGPGLCPDRAPEIVTVDPEVCDRIGIRRWDGVTRLGPVPDGEAALADRVAAVARRHWLI